MKKGRELVSLPVINSTDGTQIGEIKDIYYDPQARRVIGFVVEEAGWLKGARLLQLSDVKEISNEAVYIKNDENILDSKDDNRFCDAYNNRLDVRGRKLLSDNGTELGVIGDILVNSKNGCICGYEISGGIINDLLEGRKSVIVKEPLTINEDMVIISGFMKGDCK